MTTDRKLKPQIITTARLDIGLQIATALQREYVYKSCMNCEHFDEPSEQCKKYKARPPARVIALGCLSWEDYDEIPF